MRLNCLIGVKSDKERCQREEHYGIQIDSLSDIVCFGVLPTVIGYAWGMHQPLYLAIFFFYIAMALTRLAYFNVTEEDRQDAETGERRKEYAGLPVTSISMIVPAVYILGVFFQDVFEQVLRSEERRVGKECRSRWSPYH